MWVTLLLGSAALLPASGLVLRNATSDLLDMGDHQIAQMHYGDEQIKYDLMDLPFETDVLSAGAQLHNNTAFISQKTTVTRQKPLMWVHIHKAAGTLMCHLAPLAYERIVLPNSNCNWNPQDMFGTSGNPEAGPTCLERMHYFEKHGYTYGQIERELWDSDYCWDHFDYAVMLREPIDLMHSSLNYNKKFYHGKGKAALHVLKDHMRTGRHHSAVQWHEFLILDNMQVRLLANALDVPAGQIDDSHVEKAKQVLNNFKAVGALEDLSSNALSFFGKLGWEPHMASHVRGPKKNHVKVDVLDFTPDEEDWLRDHNKYDIALYQYARSMM